MPFPLAHPAAVLPLRRFCPSKLSLPALVIGSLVPDAGYLFGQLHVAEFSHRGLVGVLGFCLPAGALLFYGLWLARFSLLRLFPSDHRRALLPLCQRTPPRPTRVLVSLLIGAWTHVFLDALTHTDGWAAEHIPALRHSFYLVGKEPLTVSDLLYLACTFCGVAWLATSYLRWVEAAAPAQPSSSPASKGLCSLVLAGAIMILALVSRGPCFFLGSLSTGLATLALVMAFLWVTNTSPWRQVAAGSQAGTGEVR